MIIKNASVFTIDGKFEEKDVWIEADELVGSMEMLSDEAKQVVLDANGCYLIPGLTDIHFHGCMGKDFCDGVEEALDIIAAYEAGVGVTTIVPATMTMPEEVLYKACEVAAKFRQAQEKGEKEGKAILCGINMEGPFISEEKMGAQNPVFIRKPDAALYENMQKRSGNMVKIVDIAPETEGAMEFIREKKKTSVMSLAHTVADYDTAIQAFEMGACHVTHLYNAMPAFSHRLPGIIGAAADTGAEVELICDGVHVHPAVVRATFKMFGEENIILISDSMMATGLCDGDYSLGGQPVSVRGNLATLSNGTIAGSATNLMECLRTAVLKMQIPLETAIKCAAENSAKSVGIFDKYGSITPGKKANLVLLKKEDLHVEKVILLGKIL